jgi:ribosomal protein L16 Arg81 hydroxylase
MAELQDRTTKDDRDVLIFQLPGAVTWMVTAHRMELPNTPFSSSERRNTAFSITGLSCLITNSSNER